MLGSPAVVLGDDKQWRLRKLGHVVRVDGDILHVTVDREFIEACGNRAWANMLRDRHPGPWRELHLHIGDGPIINSTLLSEILHLREVFGRHDTALVLVKPGARLLTMVEIMGLEKLFRIDAA